MPVIRPPRVYHDKEKKQYYIRFKKRKIYFPAGTTQKQADKLALKHFETRRQPRQHNTSINAQPLQPLYGYKRRRYADSPLVVSYSNLQKDLRTEAIKLEALKKQNELEEKTKEDKKKLATVKETVSKLADEIEAGLPALEAVSSAPATSAPATSATATSAPARSKHVARKPKTTTYASAAAGPASAAAGPSAPAGPSTPPATPATTASPATTATPATTASATTATATTAPNARQAAQRLRRLIEKVGYGARITNPPENFDEQLESDGLYSDQIAEMMAPYKRSGFLGVIASDEIEEMIKPSMGFNRFGFVMNIDPASKPGSHWVAVFVDLKDERALEYYDSFAEDPPKGFAEQMKRLIDAHDPPFYLKYKVNRIKQQAENSTLCGFHAMRFLIDRFHGKPFKECSGYSDVRSAEKQAGKMAKKYGRFGFI